MSPRVILKLLGVFIFFWGWGGASFAQADIKVEAQLDKNKVTIGEKITYTLKIIADKDIEVKLPGFGQGLENFAIEDFGQKKRRFLKRVIYEIWYKLSSYQSGSHTIPPSKILYKRKKDKEYKTIYSKPLKVEVKSLLTQKRPFQIKDIYGPLNYPFNWGLALFILTIVLGSIGSGVYFFFRKRKPSSQVKIPPHQQAYKKLELLKSKDYLERGDFKSFYVELSNILRDYIEERFQIKALEMTTEEFFSFLREANYFSPEQKNILKEVFSFSDLVKFAKFSPLRDDAQRSFSSVKNFIDQTKQQISDDNQ
ncbi:MAG: hypothetical protein DRP69_02345 [Candidatus Duberdicusella sinuisediminis]|nr:MAG: hypothetical protein DRP69_02345 [Candidatus Omnitrophota bacterium]